MKAILEFDLPLENYEFDRASHSADWFMAVWDIVTELRRRVKYGNAGDEVADVYKWVWDMLNDRGIDPYKE